MSVVLTVPGQPHGKRRHRFGKGRAYPDPVGVAHEETLAHYLRRACPRPFASGVAIRALFYRSDKQRVDIDNMLKAVLDAANGICFEDDSQVIEVLARVELDRANPRTVLELREENSTMPRGVEADLFTVCEGCGQRFAYRAYRSSPAPRFCSRISWAIRVSARDIRSASITSGMKGPGHARRADAQRRRNDRRSRVGKPGGRDPLPRCGWLDRKSPLGGLAGPR